MPTPALVSRHPSEFTVNPANIRTQQVNVEDLKQSILENGQLQPCVARELENGTYEIVAGRRRLEACKQLGIPCVAILHEDMSDIEALSIVASENIHRADINVIDKAMLINEMYKAGMTIDRIAARLVMDKSDVVKVSNVINMATPWTEIAINRLGHFKMFADWQWLRIARCTKSFQVALLNRIFSGNTTFQDGHSLTEDQKNAIEQVDLLDLVASRETFESFVRIDPTNLESAPFDVTSETLDPKAGSCNNCPKRTDAQPLLYDDLAGEGVRCADKSCFDNKVTLHYRAKITEAKEKAKFEGEVRVIPRGTADTYREQIPCEIIKPEIAKAYYEPAKKDELGSFAVLEITDKKEPKLKYMKPVGYLETQQPEPTAAEAPAQQEKPKMDRAERLQSRRRVLCVNKVIARLQDMRNDIKAGGNAPKIEYMPLVAMFGLGGNQAPWVGSNILLRNENDEGTEAEDPWDVYVWYRQTQKKAADSTEEYAQLEAMRDRIRRTAFYYMSSVWISRMKPDGLDTIDKKYKEAVAISEILGVIDIAKYDREAEIEIPTPKSMQSDAGRQPPAAEAADATDDQHEQQETAQKAKPEASDKQMPESSVRNKLVKIVERAKKPIERVNAFFESWPTTRATKTWTWKKIGQLARSMMDDIRAGLNGEIAEDAMKSSSVMQFLGDRMKKKVFDISDVLRIKRGANDEVSFETALPEFGDGMFARVAEELTKRVRIRRENEVRWSVRAVADLMSIYRDLMYTVNKPNDFFFPTPLPTGNLVAAWAMDVIKELAIQGGRKSIRILEPSFGAGDLLVPLCNRLNDELSNSGITFNFDCIEVSYDLRRHGEEKLMRMFPKFNWSFNQEDFLTSSLPYQYDMVIMNPPFGATKEFIHIVRAMSMLVTNGTLISVVPAGFPKVGISGKEKDRLVKIIEDSMPNVKEFVLHEQAFASSGTNVRCKVIRGQVNYEPLING